MKIFLGIVMNADDGDVEHAHISESPDDTFHVEIWGNSEAPIILGEFRKWHHLVKKVKAFDNLYCISKFREISELTLFSFLRNNGYDIKR